MFPLKPFQEIAVSKLKDQFLDLWKSNSDRIPLVFKSPTGSGKTIMLAQFLRDIISDPRFIGNDVAFLWMSKGPTLVEQSKNKLFEYYGGASELELLDINDLNRKVMTRNSVFFINWEKLKGQSKDVLKIRRENEQDISFDGMIEATHEEKRKIVVIIDEEHLGADTDKALELIDGLIKPKILIRASATPKYEPTLSDLEDKKAGFIRVKREDVIREGLIKEKIIFQTEEDLNQKQFKGMDQDKILVELAYQKRNEIISYYKDLNIDINPLVLIQLPNDDKASKETNNATKLDIVIGHLKEKKIQEKDIAIWLSEDKVNLEDLEKNNSNISFLLFKQAVATGWDCPRASVLVMYREIKNPTFAIQTVGRILRMPLGVHFGKPELNLGYLYTNYKRNEVISEYGKNKNENKPAIYGSYRKKDVKPLKIESVFMSRADYNDLGDSFQSTFKKIANKHFDIKGVNYNKELSAKGIDIKPNVTNGIIVGVEIDDYDNFTKELLAEGGSHDQEMSQSDIEKLYNLVCFNIIRKQTDENKKFAPERSWGKLKTALNVWILPMFGNDRLQAYKIILNDLLKEGSILKPVIGEALETYRPIRENEVNKKSERAKRTDIIEIPRESLFFTDNYEEIKGVKKSAMDPFYAQIDIVDNEKMFIKLLEEKGNSIEWWYKNGDSGSEFLSISYYNSDENKEKLFYPDWIIKTKTKTWIIDTKAGFTAESSDTKYKAEALQEWLKSRKGFEGGIAVKDENGWKININKEYSYTPAMKGWSILKL